MNSEHKTEYLAKGFSSLKQGDAIITTNWDILAEKILFSLNKWQPSDGCGFQRTFVKYNRRQNIHEELKIEPSQVSVLKLHGSIGWRLGDSKIYEEPRLMLDTNYNLPLGNFYFVKANYLGHFLHEDGKDKEAPYLEETPLDSPIMIRPSFIKPLNHPILQEIWKKATDALAFAEKVIFIGYSLPEADMGIRVLLNPLRDRSSKKEVEVHVVDKNKNMELHWKSFLGDNIIFHNETAKKYLSEPF